jgi:tRNA G10  N-methylase Trm11
MTQSVAILGRQTALGLAELESLFGAEKITTLGIHAAQIDAAPVDVDIHRLGGSLRIAKLLTYLPYTDWKNLERYITQELPKHVCCLPPGKIQFGLSTYGFNVSPAQINASALAMKKVVKNAGRSIRVIPNKEAELNTAQVLHNKLAEQPLGMELLLIKDGQRTVLAQTAAVQDIEAYAARDQARPKRDAKVGMLPPKLAQIVLNLAVNENTQSVLDPFCGTGVILQEALLMGYDAYGTDLEDRMIDYSSANLEWLAEKRDFKGQTYLLETGDATTYEWQEFDTIACETYLGRPFSAPPAGHILDEVIQDVDTIHRKFLKNVARQSKTGFKMTIAVPAWKTTKGFKHLKTLDSLEELGYTRVSFVHVLNSDLIYHRENQIVARELVTIVRK